MGSPFSQASEDTTLVHHATQGNPTAFAWLIDRHAPRIKRLLRAILEK
ncbi:MAG TPA: hypothetical protein VI451_17500 [Anaerolineales bacterium]|nr:hypothetical protein [Anaerolineales bacterium]